MNAICTASYIPVAGTWEREKETADGKPAAEPSRWFRRNSAFDKAVLKQRIERVEQDGDPAKKDMGWWSGDLNGMLYQFGSGHADWIDGGNRLRWFLERRPDPTGCNTERTTIIIAHSHGGQVAAYALAGIDTRKWTNDLRLITVDMPVRRDMHRTYLKAKRRLNRWVHLYSTRWTKMRLLGSRFGPLTLDCANANIHIEGGHSGMLRDPALFDRWGAVLRETREAF